MDVGVEIEAPVEGSLVQLVSFFLDKEEYAVDILRVQEILRVREMTRVPKSPSFIKGVINLRGKIVPIMDLRARFGLNSIPIHEGSRIVVVDHNGKIVGLIVDSMSEVLRIPKEYIHQAPTTSNVQTSKEYIKGVAKLDTRLLIFLDLERLLAE
jgi:purine-binding chemotaxis protein CheW